MPSGTRIALFHDDSEIAGAVIAFAGEASLEIIRPFTASALEAELSNPLTAAVVLDLAGAKNGGFELLERVANAASKPQVIVVTALDPKTVDSIRRLGNTKGLKLRVFRKDDRNGLRSCLAALEKRELRFGPEHLKEAIEQELIRVEYQPKVPLDSSSEEYAVEALCRLNHPTFGNVYPDHFIPIAEKNELIAQLTDCVARQSFRDLNAWRDEGLNAHLAINISPELLKLPDWCEQFMRRCEEFGIEPQRITLEITESSSGATLDVALDVLTRLRLKGFTLSIDDFGTGFSSLATLYKLPFSELKIDKSFTFDLQESPEARALIESTIGMAQRLGLKVVAEGVETEAVFRELRLMGCQHAQGYFVSKSMTPDKVAQFFVDWTSLMKSEPIHQADALPKIAIIQSLLSDVLNESGCEDDSTLVLSEFGGPRAAQEDSTIELTRKIPTLVLQGQVVAALARCQAAVHRLERNPRRAPLKGKILQLRQLLEQELICKEDMELVAGNSRVRLLPRREVLIGRPASGKTVDVAVGCRWFSRGDKNLRLFSDAETWLVEDLGSTNGSSIGNQTLERGQPYALPYGETLIEIGKRATGIAPIAVRLRRLASSPGVIVVTLVADEERLDGRVEERQWPSWREDLGTSWVLLDGRAGVGTSKNCAIVLPDAGAEIAAEIWFHDGFRIAPSPDVTLLIAEMEFKEEVPLPAGADLRIGGVSLRAEILKSATPSEIAIAAPLSAKAR